jgi:hypothetical protein
MPRMLLPVYYVAAHLGDDMTSYKKLQDTDTLPTGAMTQPAGITGALGSRSNAPIWAAKVNGSLAHAGRTVGVKLGCGSRGVSAGQSGQG